MENKVIAKEYVKKNYVHKDVIREILRDIVMVSGIPVKNTSKKQIYKAMQTIYDMVEAGKIWNIGL